MQGETSSGESVVVNWGELMVENCREGKNREGLRTIKSLQNNQAVDSVIAFLAPFE